MSEHISLPISNNYKSINKKLKYLRINQCLLTVLKPTFLCEVVKLRYSIMHKEAYIYGNFKNDYR